MYKEILDKFKDKNIGIFRIDLSGIIIVISDGVKIIFNFNLVNNSNDNVLGSLKKKFK